ncbi:MAG: metallophosphoesterase [Treponemataceae bacterium]|nr:metallophosphoesterase [Treponemataceae bacterium]
MNSLLQENGCLLGSLESVESLSKKQSARLLVISDSHGNKDVLLDIIEEFGLVSDALVFCGDGLRELISIVNDAYHDVKLMAKIPTVIAFVRGNCDREIYETEVSSGPLNCSYSVGFVAAGRQIFVTHGHRFSVMSNPDMLLHEAQNYNADIVLYGHTHYPRIEEVGGTLIVNPGSCSRPRGTDIPSFSVVEYPGKTERYEVQHYGIECSAFGKNSFYPMNF